MLPGATRVIERADQAIGGEPLDRHRQVPVLEIRTGRGADRGGRHRTPGFADGPHRRFEDRCIVIDRTSQAGRGPLALGEEPGSGHQPGVGALGLPDDGGDREGAGEEAAEGRDRGEPEIPLEID